LQISSIETTLSLENINIHDITGTFAYAIALDVSEALMVQIIDLSIQNIINNDGGVVEVYSSKNVTVTLLNGINLKTLY